jgi:sugar phosphate isomerase/epimerase
MNLQRRDFIRTLGLASVGMCGSRLNAFAEPSGQRRLQNIGVIGGVPKDAGADWQASLRRTAEFGYTELESRSRGESTAEFSNFLKEIGMTLVACGVNFGKTLKSDWLDMARELKARYAVTYWPWFYAPEKLTLDQLKEIAAQLNRCGEQCRQAGLKFAFHNHDKDFRVLDDKPLFDRLLELTDPKLVAVEMDLYWVIKAGADPLDYFKRYPGRFELFHVKDMGPAPERGFVAVGAGTIDFARIFAQAEQAGAKHFIVELEKDANSTKNFEASCRYLRQLRF